VRIWDPDEGELLSKAEGVSGSISALAVAPDGKRVALGSKDGLVLYDPTTWKVLRRIRARAYSATFSPDGAQLVASDGQNAQVFDARSGKLVKAIAGGGSSARFSSDGSLLVIAGRDAELKLVDPKTLETKQTIKSFMSSSAALNADASLAFVALENGTVTVYDTANGEEVRSFRAHGGDDIGRIALAAHPHGKRVVTSGDTSVALWEPRTGELVKRIDVGMKAGGLALSGDGKLAAVTDDKEIAVVDLESGKVAQRFAHPGGARHFAFAPDGRTLYSGGNDGTVLVWDVPAPAKDFK
jgi:WD40 repeat protein